MLDFRLKVIIIIGIQERLLVIQLYKLGQEIYYAPDKQLFLES
jgi:hypothetical protein